MVEQGKSIHLRHIDVEKYNFNTYSLTVSYTHLDHIMDLYNIEKIKTIGDAYMAAGGVPHFNAASPVDTVNAGLAMIEAVDKLNLKRAKLGNLPFEVRIGINSGPVVAGIVGIKKFAYDIWGCLLYTSRCV